LKLLRGRITCATVALVMDDTQRFAQSELILAGHGSTQNADSSRPVYQHAAALRRRGQFARISEAFWKQPPFLNDVWRTVDTPEVFVVPLMISEGYFTTEVIPLALGLRQHSGRPLDRVQIQQGRTVRYSQPIGTHRSMTGALLARAHDALSQHPTDCPPRPDRTALFIAGHGTPRNKGSRRSIEEQVERIRALDCFAEVHAVFIEERPRIDEIYTLARASDVVVVPFFISDGLHVQEDIPVFLGESEALVRARVLRHEPVWSNPTSRAGKRVWYTLSIGSEPKLTDVILDRIHEVAACSPGDSDYHQPP
jgi:sirohydrochlorin cobaltochelatase